MAGSGNRGTSASVLALATVGTLVLAVLCGLGVWAIRLDDAGVPVLDALGALPPLTVLRPGILFVVVPTALVAVSLGAIALARRGRRSPRSLPIAVGATAIASTLVALLATAVDPELDPVTLTLGDGAGTIAGRHVATTGDRVYVVATDAGDPRQALDGGFRPSLVEVAGDVVEDEAVVEDRDEASAAPATASRSEGGSQAIETDSPERAFAPLVVLHPSERWMPTDVDALLAESRLWWAESEFCPDAVLAVGRGMSPKLGVDEPLVAARLGPHPRAYRHHVSSPVCSLPDGPMLRASDHTRPWDRARRIRFKPKQGFYLKVSREGQAGTRPRVVAPGRREVTVPAYWERTAAPGAGPGAFRITYWLLFGRSVPPVPKAATNTYAHQGDWERISVLVRRLGRGRYRPLSVRHHFYDRTHDVDWRSAARAAEPRARVASHPTVYAALGSHSTLWAPGRYPMVLRSHVYERPPDWVRIADSASACETCLRWRTWRALRSARAHGWYGYGGAWGAAWPGGQSSNTGPLGPSSHELAGAGAPKARELTVGPPRRALPDGVEALAGDLDDRRAELRVR